MKRSFNPIYILIILLLIIGCQPEKQKSSIILGPEWLFKTGDDPQWALPETDENSWEHILTGKNWDKQGYKDLDGYAWYRIHFHLPKSIRKNAFLKDSLKINLGKIDDFDEVYLNGQIMGYNGISLPAGSSPPQEFIIEPSPWNKSRHYKIPTDDPRILWDKGNVLAVRVFDRGGLGGMFHGKISVSMAGIGDYLHADLQNHVFEYSDGEYSKTFSFINTSVSTTISGQLLISAINDLGNNEIYNDSSGFQLAPGGGFSFNFKLPEQHTSTGILYTFRHDKSSFIKTWKDELPYIQTPPPGDKPRINGPIVYGARPGNPFLYRIPATGKKPMEYKAFGLPKGLSLDPETGIIKGKVSQTGKYNVELTVSNETGMDEKKFTILIGDKIALTPPMGWNSWNCWGLSVTQEQVLAAARSFRRSGLADHGWAYINIDDGWEIQGDSDDPKRAKNGAILTNQKFPNMKALGDSIHNLGLKFGIYTSPGPLTCGGYTASYQHELQDAQTFASWGVDYIKYDWCSYGRIAPDHSKPELKKPYLVMKEALDKVNRDIVYSLCQYGMGKVWEWGAETGGNLWRTTGDIVDTWESMSSIGFNQVACAPNAKPGHWNDPDMLVLGWVGWGPHVHPTRLTPNEQYTHISLWCLLSAPLLLGNDLERMDEFTISLLTNDEVIAINQDPLGKQATPKIVQDSLQVWTKKLSDGSLAVGIFNLASVTRLYTLHFEKLDLPNSLSVRDLWRQRDVGEFNRSFELGIAPHGVKLLKLH